MQQQRPRRDVSSSPSRDKLFLTPPHTVINCASCRSSCAYLHSQDVRPLIDISPPHECVSLSYTWTLSLRFTGVRVNNLSHSRFTRKKRRSKLALNDEISQNRCVTYLISHVKFNNVRSWVDTAPLSVSLCLTSTEDVTFSSLIHLSYIYNTILEGGHSFAAISHYERPSKHSSNRIDPFWFSGQLQRLRQVALWLLYERTDVDCSQAPLAQKFCGFSISSLELHELRLK